MQLLAGLTMAGCSLVALLFILGIICAALGVSC